MQQPILAKINDNGTNHPEMVSVLDFKYDRDSEDVYAVCVRKSNMSVIKYNIAMLTVIAEFPDQYFPNDHTPEPAPAPQPVTPRNQDEADALAFAMAANNIANNIDDTLTPNPFAI